MVNIHQLKGWDGQFKDHGSMRIADKLDTYCFINI